MNLQNHFEMKIKISFILITIIYINFCKANDQDVLIVKIGESSVLSAKTSDKIIVQKNNIVVLSKAGNKVLVRGRSQGNILVSVGTKAVRVNVLTEKQYREYVMVKNIVSESYGLKLDLISPLLRVYGDLLRANDWKKIIDLDVTDLNLKFEAVVHPKATASTLEMLKSYFKTQNIPPGDINLSSIPVVSYASDQNKTKHKFYEIVSKTGLKIATNPLSLETAPMVRTQIIVASLKKTYSQKLGIKWPGAYKAQVLPELNYSENADENSVQLNALESNGWGKVLASPSLLCRSGKEASFLAGGEFPIRVVGYKQKDVVWKSYGVRLNIKPLADYLGQMSISIETEVSALDTSNMVEGIPAITANRMNSHFDLKKTRTIALSGLITKNEGDNKEGLPFLSRIPILGGFFTSREYLEDQSELVIFVTPQIVLPYSDEDGGSHESY